MLLPPTDDDSRRGVTNEAAVFSRWRWRKRLTLCSLSVHDTGCFSAGNGTGVFATCLRCLHFVGTREQLNLLRASSMSLSQRTKMRVQLNEERELFTKLDSMSSFSASKYTFMRKTFRGQFSMSSTDTPSTTRDANSIPSLTTTFYLPWLPFLIQKTI